VSAENYQSLEELKYFLFKNFNLLLNIGVARGALRARAPQGGEKNGGGDLQGKVVSAPQAESTPPRQSKNPIF